MKKIDIILKVIDNQDITPAEFERKSQISNGYLKNTISRGSDITPKILDKIKNNNPEDYKLIVEALASQPGFTPEDALFINPKSNAKDLGPVQGEFETYQTKSGNSYQIVGDGNYRFEVKVVEQLAYAGYLAGWADPEYIESLPSTVITVKKFHTGTYRVFEVKGDSMDCDRKYAIENGDCVIGHKVEKDLWRSKLHIKDWAEWVIVSDEGIIIKHILHHDVENRLLICRSYNEDKDMYPDFDLSLDNVYELYNVVKVEKSRLG